jgi:hypothetical protein
MLIISNFFISNILRRFRIRKYFWVIIELITYDVYCMELIYLNAIIGIYKVECYLNTLDQE